MRVILPLTKEQKDALARMINPKSVEDYGMGISVTITESEKIIDGGLDMTDEKPFDIDSICQVCGGPAHDLPTATPKAPAAAEDSGRKVI